LIKRSKQKINKNKTTMKTIIEIILGIGLAALLFWGVMMGISRAEKIECRTWQKEAQEIQGYWLTQWQADQCQAHGIKVEAPIKTQL